MESTLFFLKRLVIYCICCIVLLPCKYIIKLISHYLFETECQASSGVRKSDLKVSSSSRQANDASGNKLERRTSFRQKFGALFKETKGDFSTAINRGLQPIRRSLSFKDLNRGETKKPYRTSSMQWYNSLSSLAEDEHVDEAEIAYKKTTDEKDIVNGRVQVTRTRSMIEKPLVCISRL